jgi:uncharacterized protein YdeI (YjbR/CyaY-like superfamily)
MPPPPPLPPPAAEEGHRPRPAACRPRLSRREPPPDNRAMVEEARVQPEDRAEWRAWLEAHHCDSSAVWVVFWRPRARRDSLQYEEAVEEALCFAWIDGKAGRVDDDRTMVRFSPRRPGSAWARSNKERVARLSAAGLMTEAGLQAVADAQADGSWTLLDAIDALIVPDDLDAGLAARPGARARFDEYSPSARRMMLAWVTQAKRPATRAARLAAVVDVVDRGAPAMTLWPSQDRTRDGAVRDRAAENRPAPNAVTDRPADA